MLSEGVIDYCIAEYAEGIPDRVVDRYIEYCNINYYNAEYAEGIPERLILLIG